MCIHIKDSTGKKTCAYFINRININIYIYIYKECLLIHVVHIKDLSDNNLEFTNYHSTNYHYCYMQ